jgi:hypothetical protein
MTVPARYRCSCPWPAKAAPASGETPLDSGYAAIAFFAGFSERRAQSTLKNAIPLSGPSAPPSDTRVLSSHSEGKLVGR